MSSVEIDYCGEGRSDSAIARALIKAAGASPGKDYYFNRRSGKSALDERMKGLNAGAAFGNPVLILRDLDSEPCASALVARLLPRRHQRCLLRICVRTAEAWLIADQKAYADFAGLPVGKIPLSPDDESGLKDRILQWAKNGTAKHLARDYGNQRANAVPDWQILGVWAAGFATAHWNPTRAANASPSLVRAIHQMKMCLAA